MVEPVKTVACQFQFQVSHSVQPLISPIQIHTQKARIDSLGIVRGETKERMGWKQVVEAGGQNVVVNVNDLSCTEKPNEIISDQAATSYS